ncbi:hypothetical protein G9A89_019186 [Geosiphon pyriformis]|nr:hypothetical protein G9A89_019186 [Geosiphon pyriformis]
MLNSKRIYNSKALKVIITSYYTLFFLFLAPLESTPSIISLIFHPLIYLEAREPPCLAYDKIEKRIYRFGDGFSNFKALSPGTFLHTAKLSLPFNTYQIPWQALDVANAINVQNAACVIANVSAGNKYIIIIGGQAKSEKHYLGFQIYDVIRNEWHSKSKLKLLNPPEGLRNFKKKPRISSKGDGTLVIWNDQDSNANKNVLAWMLKANDKDRWVWKNISQTDVLLDFVDFEKVDSSTNLLLLTQTSSHVKRENAKDSTSNKNSTSTGPSSESDSQTINDQKKPFIIIAAVLVSLFCVELGIGGLIYWRLQQRKKKSSSTTLKRKKSDKSKNSLKVTTWNSSSPTIDYADLSQEINSIDGGSRFEALIRKKKVKFLETNELESWEKIGQGGNGVVISAYYVTKSMKVALKFIPSSLSHAQNDIDDRKLFHELRTLLSVPDHVNPISKKYMLVLQYANGGNLRSYLKESYSALLWPDRISIAKQVTSGLNHLHSNSIQHRDLHTLNVLIHHGRAILTDFGLSKIIDSGKTMTNNVLQGVIPFIDPQKLKDSQHYKQDFHSDIYGLGVILWEISSGRKPFENREYDYLLIMSILNGEREEPVSNTPLDFMNVYSMCWNEDPSLRPTAAEVLRLLEIPLYDSGSPNTNVDYSIQESFTTISFPEPIHMKYDYSSTEDSQQINLTIPGKF